MDEFYYWCEHSANVGPTWSPKIIASIWCLLAESVGGYTPKWYRAECGDYVGEYDKPLDLNQYTEAEMKARLEASRKELLKWIQKRSAI